MNSADIKPRARSLMQQKEWEAASDLWASARVNAPEELEPYTSGVEVLIRAYKFEAAEKLVAQIEERFPQSAAAKIFLATFLTRKGRWDRAVHLFESVAEVAPAHRGQIMKNSAYRQAVLNAFGIQQGSAQLDPITHAQCMGLAAGRPHPAAREGYIFVAGMPRSGTTALGHLLNAVSSIALVTEMHNPYLVYSSESFGDEVMRRCVARNASAASSALLDKAINSPLVGDKRPLFHYGLPLITKTMQNCRLTILHMLRPLQDISSSYHKRASDPLDGWDPLRSLENCIWELNVMHQYLGNWGSEVQRNPLHKMLYVDYSRIFSDEEYAIEVLCECGARATPGLRESIKRLLARSVEIANKERVTPHLVRQKLAEKLDFSSAQSFERKTGVHVLGDLSSRTPSES